MMNKGIKYTDISEMRSAAEWLKLTEEVEATQQPRLLTREGKEVLELRPAKPAKRKRAKTGLVTKDDPIWNLVGVGHSGAGDISANTDKYLAEAYLDQHKTL